MKYQNADSEFLIGVEPISVEQADSLAMSFLEFEGYASIELTRELYFPHVAVYHFSALDGDEEASAWLTGGLLPHVLWNDERINNPIEALAIYCLQFIYWIGLKGVSTDDWTVPPYKLAPDWRLLTDEELEDTEMLYLVSYISKDLLRPNQAYIQEPEIRGHCIFREWLDPD